MKRDLDNGPGLTGRDETHTHPRNLTQNSRRKTRAQGNERKKMYFTLLYCTVCCLLTPLSPHSSAQCAIGEEENLGVSKPEKKGHASLNIVTYAQARCRV